MNEKTNQKKTALFDFRGLLKNQKAVKVIIYGGVALILLLFIADMFSSPKTQQAEYTTDSVAADCEKQLEQKLEKAISAIDGVGALTIVVTIDSLSETVYSEKGTSVKTVITPKARGVAIICEGGDDIVIKQKIVELVSRVLGISSTRISVTN